MPGPGNEPRTSRSSVWRSPNWAITARVNVEKAKIKYQIMHWPKKALLLNLLVVPPCDARKKLISYGEHLAFKSKRAKKKKKRPPGVEPHDYATYASQGHTFLLAGRVGWFCLLCCQPKPFLTSLQARTSWLSLRFPCPAHPQGRALPRLNDACDLRWRLFTRRTPA